MPGDLPPPPGAGDGDGGGVDFGVYSGAGLPEYEETCAQHESGDGTFLCTFRVKIPTTSDIDSITGTNRKCIYSKALGRTYCYWTQVVLDMNGDGIVSPEDLTAPSDEGVDFDVNAAENAPGTADPAYQPTGFDYAAVSWAGSGTGVCPDALPKDGDPCAQHVGPKESMRACTYNYIQCRCALQNRLADLTGWSCRDTRGGFGP